MKKRVLSLVLAGVMAIGLLTGCGNNSASESSNTDPSKTEEGGELTTVKVLCKNDFSADIKTEDWEKYPVSQVFIQELEEIGIRLELECIDNDSFANVVQTRMAAGVDIPDLVSYTWEVNAADTLIEYANNGLIYSLDELLSQYDEDGSIRKFYDEKAPGVWEKDMAQDGKLYWFSYLMNQETESVDAQTGVAYKPVWPHMASIRKDWVEAVGENVKEVYTPEELRALVKKMQDQDVNGNGSKDEIMYLPIDSFGYIAQAFGLTNNLMPDYFQEDNKVFSNFAHENFSAYIEWMQSLYKDGLIDTTALTTTMDEMISQERAAVVTQYATWTYEDALPNAENDKSYYVPIMVDMDGDLSNGFTISVDSTESTSYSNYFIPKAAKNPEGVIKLMDYIYSEEYALLDWYGLEGKGYTKNDDGSLTKIAVTPDNPDTYSLFEASIGQFGLPAVRGLFTETAERYAEDAPVYVKDKYDWVFNFSTELYDKADHIHFGSQTLAMPTEEETAVLSEKGTVLSTYAQELLADLILGNKSLDDMPKYLEEMDNLGMQDYIDVIQARRDRVLGN